MGNGERGTSPRLPGAPHGAWSRAGAMGGGSASFSCAFPPNPGPIPALVTDTVPCPWKGGLEGADGVPGNHCRGPRPPRGDRSCAVPCCRPGRVSVREGGPGSCGRSMRHHGDTPGLSRVGSSPTSRGGVTRGRWQVAGARSHAGLAARGGACAAAGVTPPGTRCSPALALLGAAGAAAQPRPHPQAQARPRGSCCSPLPHALFAVVLGAGSPRRVPHRVGSVPPRALPVPRCRQRRAAALSVPAQVAGAALPWCCRLHRLRRCRYIIPCLRWGCGTCRGWGRSGCWGCCCACSCVGVSGGVVGAGTRRCRARLRPLRAAGSGQLRLVGGGGRCAGRVEVNHDGEWGSVCVYDVDWEARWATVVCRQLGCGRVASSSPYAPFGQGSGRIWLQPFFCGGTEEVLEECPHFGWGQHHCGHERDVGVTCTEAVELRLVDGGGPCAGRVEVKLRGHWGSVADNNWDMEDAEVVCQQLGCGSAAGAYSARDRFGIGAGPINLAVVDCKGEEATLWDCKIRGWGPYNGTHEFDTAVICQGFSWLVGGDRACAGRLEVRQSQAWVGVCAEHVDMKVAQVVCRELGCGAALAISGSGRFGAGTGPLWEGGFNCTGSEPLLSACARWVPHSQGCTGHATIICSPYTGFRLGNSSSGCAGRVEVAVRGTWGSVCATDWDLPDADVLCRHLGCGHAVTVPPGGSFGSGDGPLRPDAFGCSGSERHPGECPVAVLGEPPCTPGNAAAVNCSGLCGACGKSLQGLLGHPRNWERSTQGCFGMRGGLNQVPQPHGTAGDFSGTEGTVNSMRLVEGESRCDGRLEEAITTPAWRRVPVEQWKRWDVDMVCAVLGCGLPKEIYTALGMAPTALTSSAREVDVVTEETDVVTREMYDISGMGPELIRSLEETEDVAEEISDVLGMGPAPTSSPEEMVIVCSGGCPEKGRGAGAPSSPQPGPSVPAGSRRVRLAGGAGRCAGRVEVYAGGTWSSVCQERWDLRAAAVVCRELGCGAALEAPGSARFGPGAGTAWPYVVECAGSEESLWECPRSEQRECERGAGAGAVCSEQLSLRLAGGRGRCSGYLELLHNGTWGRVCATGTSPGTAAAVCRQLGCGDGGQLAPVPAQQPAPAWLAWVGCEEGARSLWGCPSAPWHLQACGPGGDTYVACAEDSDNPSETASTPCPDGATCTAVPSSSGPAVARGTVPVAVVLCVVLGTLLCLALGALAVLICRARAWRRGAGRAVGAIPDAIYEELDYRAMPEYQEVPSRPGSPREGSVKKLLCYTGDSVEGSDTGAAPVPASPALPGHGTPDGYDDATAGTSDGYDDAMAGTLDGYDDAMAGTLDGYDDATAVPEESPAPSTGDISEGVAQRGWICVPPTGKRYHSCPICPGEPLHRGLATVASWDPSADPQRLQKHRNTPGGVWRGDTELSPSGTCLCCPQGGSCPPPSPPGATRDPPGQPSGHRDCDDVGTGAPGMLQ
ncbi:scavenger receptor cysteine-rich type 1 protein M130-like [Pipra filicauda]|uniref:Scavenger receptor cysteine-rich type 1 protein M130-like n=1 Tax=Pipra filicauda TaxID=649802 RepID=A0A7R5KZK7_9PASS|nr:scavenger receptor cysteine-rich type 1 protein M130-like [Pipra filicauda]